MRHFFILVACIFLLCGCENIVNAFSTSLGTQLTRKYDFSSYSLKDLSDKLSAEYTTLEQKKDILAEMDKKNGAEVSKLSKDEKNNIISAVAEVTCSTEIIAAIAEEINFDALGETNVSSILATLPDADSSCHCWHVNVDKIALPANSSVLCHQPSCICTMRYLRS